MAKPRLGTLKLSDAARKVSVPSGITSTMWPAVERICRGKLGITFDPWQDQAGMLALAKRSDGTFAAAIDGVGMSICRQAGKTFWLAGLVFGLCILRPGTLVVWSAHHAATHGETFLSMIAFTERLRVAPYIGQVFRGSGEEEIRFRNGSRILFGCRERGFGRGIPGVDVMVADEAQIMTEKAVDAMIATMNTSSLGLAFYVGTPPAPEDPSDAFTRMRKSAWDGTLTDGVWIEFGAEPGADPSSPKTWRVNPSYPHRTPRRSIVRLQRKLSPESFLREGLGIWEEFDRSTGAFPSDVWAALVDASSKPGVGADLVFGVYVNVPGTNAAIAVASERSDGVRHIEILPDSGGVEKLSGCSWVAQRVIELSQRWSPRAVVIDNHSNAGAIVAEIEAAGVTVTTTSPVDRARADNGFAGAVDAGTIRHLGDARLTSAVLGASWRELADSRAFNRKGKGADITELVAASLALHGLSVETVAESAYNADDYDFMML